MISLSLYFFTWNFIIIGFTFAFPSSDPFSSLPSVDDRFENDHDFILHLERETQPFIFIPLVVVLSSPLELVSDTE